jgi:Protein of unknown function (DUF3149)
LQLIIVIQIESLMPTLDSYKEFNMKLLTDLFTTDYGLMSISGIAFMLCMAAFFIWYFNHKMNEADSQFSKGK